MEFSRQLFISVMCLNAGFGLVPLYMETKKRKQEELIGIRLNALAKNLKHLHGYINLNLKTKLSQPAALDCIV